MSTKDIDIQKLRDSTDINLWADYWHYYLGCNVIPFDTKSKETYAKWGQWQFREIPNELHEECKQNGDYSNGIAVMTGPMWRGPHMGRFILGIDLDNKKAIEEFVRDDLSIFKEKAIVEQHPATPDKMHLYFIVDRAIEDKGSGKTNPKLIEKMGKNQIPAIEVKASPRQMMICAISPHSDGSNYQIIGTLEPKPFDAGSIEQRIKVTLDKFGIPYGSQPTSSSDTNFNTTTTNLDEPLRQIINSLNIPDKFEYKIHEGTRHAIMLSFVNSLLIKHRNHDNRDELKDFFNLVNANLCTPPLPENEIKTIWRDAVKFAEEMIKKIEIVNNDENDSCNFNSQIVITLEQGDKLLQEEIVKDFVYDIQANSVYLDLNHKYENSKNIVPVNIKKWDEVRKTLEKLLVQKGISKEHILLLLSALDKNFDLIKQKFLENYRKHTAAQAKAEQRRAERQQLIQQGTNFLMEKYRFLTLEKTKEILYYDPKGVYVYGGDIVIEKELDRRYLFGLKTADITEITNYIRRKTYTKKEDFDKDLDIMNLENGLLNWKLGQLMPHSPDYKSLNQKPIVYNPDAKCPKFDKFLEEVLYAEDIRTAKEIIAYTFIRKNIWEYYFVLIGRGSNGKNVFVGILSHLHGLKNISNVSLKSLVKNRFSFAQLENKDINIDTELSSSFVNDMTILKKLTGSQPLMVERKGLDPYEVELWTKLFFNSNDLPLSNDNSDAHHRRQIILSFWNQFEDEPNKDDPTIKVADPYLLTKIVGDKDEMSGILNLAIESLREIDRNKKIYVNSTIRERRAKAELTADPVGGFADRYLEKTFNSDRSMTGPRLYARFEEFCKEHKLQIPADTMFSKRLKQLGYTNSRPRIDGQRVTIWYVKLYETEEDKSAAEEEKEQQQQEQGQ